jgi:fumarylacetoacetase
LTLLPLNETHDPNLASWVSSANIVGSDFPIQNLPFGIFRRVGSNETFRGGVAIGDKILDLSLASSAGVLTGLAAHAAASCKTNSLNDFMAMGPAAWSALRLALSQALREGSAHQMRLQHALIAQDTAEYTVPARIGDYTDFYTSIHHATTVGKFFRPDNPLLPNYKWIPIGYHGRTSSIGISGQQLRRPIGQILPPGSDQPVLSPSKRMDYELEMGIFIGVGNELGSAIDIDVAESHVFGLCLLNDWSARDIQSWEYQPLGPFLSKNFATTISPWIVTLEALAPYRVARTRAAEDPQPLPYLDSKTLQGIDAIDIQLSVSIETEQMRATGQSSVCIAKTSFKHCYWSIAQMVTHHAINGCNLQPGDLLGTGTQSGPTAVEAGSLLEMSLAGNQTIQLGNGETRTFLEDGDSVILRGWCEKSGTARIGFGHATGRLLAARSST